MSKTKFVLAIRITVILILALISLFAFQKALGYFQQEIELAHL